MKPGSGVKVWLNEAIEKDPTLKAVLGNPDFQDKLKENLESMISSSLENMTIDPEEGSGTHTVDLGTKFLTIGNRTYRVELGEASVEYELDDDSFSYEYGSIRGVEGGVYAAGGEATTLDEVLDGAVIRLATPEELKSLTNKEPSLTRLELPEHPGLRVRTPWKETGEYRKLASFIKERKDLANAQITDQRTPKPEVSKSYVYGERAKLREWEQKEKYPFFTGKRSFTTREAAQKAIDEYAAKAKELEEMDKQHG